MGCLETESVLMEHVSWRRDELRLTEMLANHNPCGSEATVPSGGHIQLMLFVQFTCSREYLEKSTSAQSNKYKEHY